MGDAVITPEILKIQEENIPNPINPILDQRLNPEGKEKYCHIINHNLQVLKKGYIDTIPDEIIHSYGEGAKNYKVRKAWFTALSALLEMGRDLNEIADPEAQEKINEFSQYCTSKEFKQKLVSPEDIKRGNEIIDLYLTHCKTKPASIEA